MYAYTGDKRVTIGGAVVPSYKLDALPDAAIKQLLLQNVIKLAETNQNENGTDEDSTGSDEIIGRIASKKKRREGKQVLSQSLPIHEGEDLHCEGCGA
jgi:hypothetical protein